MRHSVHQGFRLAAICSLVAFATPGNTATLSETGVGGSISFSDDRLLPTDFALNYTACNNGSFGCNILTGQFGRDAGGVVDRDYLHLIVPSGYALSQILVGTQTNVGSGTAFIGIAIGATMPLQSNAATAAGLLGWYHFGAADHTTDILDNMAIPADGSSGFSTPLAAGAYSIWLQELASGTYTYRLNFVLTPVPLPAAGWLLASALLGLAGFRRR